MRLAGITERALSTKALEHFLAALPHLRDGKAWRRYPFYYTLLALTDIDHPMVDDELRYIAIECEKKLKRLKPKDALAERRIAVIKRVLERI